MSLEEAAVACEAIAQPDPGSWPQRFAAAVYTRRRILMALVLVLYLLGYNGQWHMGPDSALYLTLGRNIAAGRGYTYHGVPHTLAYPGLPYALAGLFKLFGSHAIAAADALVLLCGLATLAATYRLIHLWSDRTTAIVVTFGLAVTHEFFRYCYEILTDIPFLLGVTAFLAGYEAIFHASALRRRWWDWLLLAGGLAIAVVTRPTMIGLLGAFLAVMIWTAFRSRSARPLALAVVAVVIVLGIIFFRFDPRHAAGAGPSRGYEKAVFHALFRGDALDTTHDRLNTKIAANVRDLFGQTAAKAAFAIPLGSRWLNAIFGSIVLAGGLALLRQRLLWGLWVLVTLAILILLISNDRYVLQAMPLLVLGWWRTLIFAHRRLPRPIANVVFAFFLALGIVPNCLLNGSIVLHQHFRPFLDYYSDGRYAPYVKMAQELPRFCAADDAVLCPARYSRVLTFLSRRDVFEEAESKEDGFGRRPPLVVFDAEDKALAGLLSHENLVVDGPPLVSIPRPTGQSPLLLMRSRFIR